MLPRLAKKFDIMVKKLEENQGTVIVSLKNPFRMEDDPNLQVKTSNHGLIYTVPVKHFRKSLDKIIRKDPLEVTFNGDNCFMRLRYAVHTESQPGFTLRDLTDLYNDPSAFNRSYRSIFQVQQQMEAAWRDDITMSELIKIATDAGVQVHQYCAND